MLKIILYGALVFLLIIAIPFYIFQRDLLYHPQPGAIRIAEWGADIPSIHLKTSDGLSLQSWYSPAKQSTLPTLLYFQGNAGHIGYRVKRLLPYLKAGYGILLLGYRAYNGNQGQASEQGFYRDARAALHFLKQQDVPSHCIVLFGESLGTGIAVQMATEYSVGAVVLQSPYTSMVEVGKKHYPFLPIRWMLKDRYDSINKMSHIHVPVFIFHGAKDRLIPVEMGYKVYQAALPPKQMKIYDHAEHSGLPNPASMVMKFLQQHQVCASS